MIASLTLRKFAQQPLKHRDALVALRIPLYTEDEMIHAHTFCYANSPLDIPIKSTNVQRG